MLRWIGRMSGRFELADIGLSLRGVGSDSACGLQVACVDRIGKIDTNGVVTESAIPTAHSIPSGVAVGPDGSIYFAELGPGKIGKMSLDGAIDEFKIPDGRPLGLAAGADGNLWATVPREHLIYRMTSGGNFIGYRLAQSTVPAFIAAAPDGNLYFTEPSGKLGRISTDGDVAEFDVSK